MCVYVYMYDACVYVCVRSIIKNLQYANFRTEKNT